VSAAEQPPIGDHALLSDSQGAALVSRGGSIDWACMPRFDSPSTFARLLDPDGGHRRLAPDEPFDVERSYVADTMVLRTEFRTSSGAVAVTEALPFLPLERGHGIGRAPHAIVRLVEGLDGDVTLVSEVAPRSRLRDDPSAVALGIRRRYVPRRPHRVRALLPGARRDRGRHGASGAEGASRRARRAGAARRGPLG
jgi:hypothetical protein